MGTVLMHHPCHTMRHTYHTTTRRQGDGADTSPLSHLASLFSHSLLPPHTHQVHMVMELMQDGSVLAAFRGRDVQQPANLLLAASVAEQVGGRGARLRTGGGRPALPRAIMVMDFPSSCQVAWALDFLHSSCGMLHLDVKGANVLLRFDGPGVVFAKLADVGATAC